MHVRTQWVLGLFTVTLLHIAASTGLSPHLERQELLIKHCENLAELGTQNLSLRCTGNDILAIHLAYFSTVYPEDCPSSNTERETLSVASEPISNNDIEDLHHQHHSVFGCTEDLRLTLNAQCSGLNNCSLDYSAATSYLEKCDPLKNGWLNIQYTCVNEKHRSAFCQQHYNALFGYLSTPGYPVYYSPFPCRWTINAEIGQRIQLQIFDLAIREPESLPAPTNRRRKPGEPAERCIDSLDIIDQDVKTRTLCGERNSNLIEYRSLGESLTIDFTPVDFLPSRGVLMKYSLVNCPTLRAPSNGYMQRNGSFAYYTCNFDNVFEDTGESELVLYCEDDHYWNGTVARCVEPTVQFSVDQGAKLASVILSNFTEGFEANDNTLSEQRRQHTESYAEMNRFLWVTVLFVVLALVSIVVIYQCVAVNVKYCFSRAGNYRVDEHPTSV